MANAPDRYVCLCVLSFLRIGTFKEKPRWLCGPFRIHPYIRSGEQLGVATHDTLGPGCVAKARHIDVSGVLGTIILMSLLRTPSPSSLSSIFPSFIYICLTFRTSPQQIYPSGAFLSKSWRLSSLVVAWTLCLQPTMLHLRGIL